MVVKGVGWGGGVTLWRHCGTRHVASGWSCGSLPLEGVVSRFSVKAAAAAAVTNMVLLSQSLSYILDYFHLVGQSSGDSFFKLDIVSLLFLCRHSMPASRISCSFLFVNV